MGGQVWLPAEDDFLRQHVRSMSRRQIAARLKRTEFAVRTRINVLGLDGAWWSQDDIELLLAYYPTASWEDLEDSIGRPREAIAQKASKLGVKRLRPARKVSSKPQRDWRRPPQLVHRVLSLAGKRSFADIASECHVTRGVVAGIIRDARAQG